MLLIPLSDMYGVIYMLFRSVRYSVVVSVYTNGYVYSDIIVTSRFQRLGPNIEKQHQNTGFFLWRILDRDSFQY